MDILENMRKMLEAGKISKEDIERAFPELKESEDERIRKEIIDELKIWREHLSLEGRKQDADKITDEIAYLEKQKEQAADEKYAGMVVVSQEEWDAAIAEAFKIGRDEGERQRKQQPAEWSEEDKSILNNIVAYKVLNIDDLEWLKSLPERFNLQPKQEWSEEDEKILNGITNCLCVTSGDIDGFNEWYDWLNFLPERISRPKSSDNWKPSEEQMEVLQNEIKCCYACGTHERAKQLKTIYDDLKKL